MDMKRLVRVAALGAATSVAVSGWAFAQGVPAEQPPASFTGVQYIDSEGCVFIRAGVAGAVEWVPRVGRDRQPICGQTPSAASRTASASAPSSSQTENVVVIGGTGSTSTTTTTTRPVTTAPRPAIATVAAPTATVTVRAPATSPTPVSGGVSACTGANAIYFRGDNVRCGPQATHPGPGAGGVVGGTATVAAASADGVGSLRVPRTAAPPPVPEGFRSAYDDDRLNPLRGVGTPAGDAQMALVWTNTVPRRLVDARTGQPVGAMYPGLRSPTTTAVAVAPEADGVTASSRAITPRTRTVPGATTQAIPEAVAAGPEPIRVSTQDRHVLAGTYPSRAEADRAYARLAATGLPMRLGQIDRSTGMVYAVVAGPFATTDALVTALRTAQAAGFSGAATRR